MNKKTNVGERLSQLLRQYEVRIAYAKGKIDLYEEEMKKSSALGKSQSSANARVCFEVWKVYATNLKDKHDSLVEEIRKSLIGYNKNERVMWVSYFIEGKTCEEIAPMFNVDERTIARKVAKMRSELELRFDMPNEEVCENGD